MSGWQYLTHPDLPDTGHLVPDNAGVVEGFEAHGWVRAETPEDLLPDQPDKGWTVDQAKAAEEAERLKGEALDEALKEKGLPRTGKADEKRARLAEAETEGDKE